VEGPDPIFEPAQMWNSHQRWAGQDNGDPTDERRVPLDDPRLQGATRFTYDRYLALPNPKLNFHVAFTRGGVIMPAAMTNQTKMVIPEFQANQSMDQQVDVDQVRPWGLAAEEDMQAPPKRDNWGQPAWVAELTGPANNWNLRALAPMPRTDGEEEMSEREANLGDLDEEEDWEPEEIDPYGPGNQEPGQEPGSKYSAKHSCDQVLASLDLLTKVRLSSGPPGLATAPEGDTEEPELAPAEVTQGATYSWGDLEEGDELALPVGAPEGSTPAAPLPEPDRASTETMDSWATAMYQATHMGQARHPAYSPTELIMTVQRAGVSTEAEVDLQ
jgi:hypothetical protein